MCCFLLSQKTYELYIYNGSMYQLGNSQIILRGEQHNGSIDLKGWFFDDITGIIYVTFLYLLDYIDST